REQAIVRWLDLSAKDADAIYLLGDTFDYWFEYGEVIPRGFVRILGKLAELRDRGIPIYAFTGNHDMWMFGYFEKELGIPVYREPVLRTIDGKTFMIGHGDGLGPGDHGYKFIKRIFRSKLCQWLFARIHPNTGIRLMKYFSGTSRTLTSIPDFLGEEKEWLIQYCNHKLKAQHIDYFIFGHRHIPIDHLLNNGKSRYLNCGDWLTHYSYAAWDGAEVQLLKYEDVHLH
ncbi:MAG TPA: UDP-2,3-diacylglucosamine diphosphatase, partial [Saprospiraceae bacterium]|nr:UDP-2,3-diacylglucosamine diphosphatase [Saprospiraceae bacterium]